MIEWVINFLIITTTKIKAAEEISKNIITQRGVPQGSALSSILYFIYFNDTNTSPHNQTELGLFADDTVYWTTVKPIISNLQNIAKTFTKWCKTWRLELSENKTQFVFFFLYPSGHAQGKTRTNVFA